MAAFFAEGPRAWGRIAVALSLAVAACNRADAEGKHDAVPMPPAAARGLGADTPRVVAPGVVEPVGREVGVSADEPGRVVEVRATEGERVERGQVLAVLEHSAQKLGVAQAKAAPAVAKAPLARARAGSRPEEISAADAEWRAQAARRDLAERQADRWTRLHAAKAATTDEQDRATQEREASRAATEAAGARLRLARAGARVEDLWVAQAGVEQATEAVHAAEAALERRLVRAPIAGTVLWLRVRPGEFFAPGPLQSIAVVGDVSRLQVRADVDELDVARVRPGAEAVITADGVSEPLARGKVIEVAWKMGRKNVRSDEPTERVDTKIREVVVQLEPAATDLARAALVVGLRVRATIAAK